jgi:hypothetical protein
MARDQRVIIANLLPKDVNLNLRPFDELTDEQLLRRLRVLTEQVGPLLGKLEEMDMSQRH